MNDFKWRDCYVSFVNLPHRTDRLEHMTRELNRVGIAAERTTGMYPTEFDQNDPRFQTQFNRTPGSLGCMFSQMKIMQKAYDFGKSAIVLEDDLIIATDIKKRLDYIENFVNTKEPLFDIVFLGGTVHNPAWWHKKGHDPMLQMCTCTLEKDMERIDDERMVRVYGMFSTHAYIVRYGSIQKILSLLEETMPISIGIDYSLILHEPNLRCFAFLPGCIKQYNAVSDIGTGITYFENFSKLNGTIENSRYWWADKMDEFNLKDL